MPRQVTDPWHPGMNRACARFQAPGRWSQKLTKLQISSIHVIQCNHINNNWDALANYTHRFIFVMLPCMALIWDLVVWDFIITTSNNRSLQCVPQLQNLKAFKRLCQQKEDLLQIYLASVTWADSNWLHRMASIQMSSFQPALKIYFSGCQIQLNKICPEFHAITSWYLSGISTALYSWRA